MRQGVPDECIACLPIVLTTIHDHALALSPPEIPTWVMSFYIMSLYTAPTAMTGTTSHLDDPTVSVTVCANLHFSLND